MTKIQILLLCICSLHVSAQTDSLKAIEEIMAFQKKLNDDFRNLQTSPLEEEGFAKFEGHNFFPINLDYRVEAKLSVTRDKPFFPMLTSTSMYSTERIYGYVIFTLEKKKFRLPVYQSKELMGTKEYADYLLFPFSDKTNGRQTYTRGRYIDLRIPKEGKSLIIDFNMAYNPYNAYNLKFSCLLVPPKNRMDIAVRAGVRNGETKEIEPPAQLVSDTTTTFTLDEVPPTYPGGFEEMMEFVKKNLRYPRGAMWKKNQGVVFVQFVIEPDGTISEITTLKGVSEVTDAEAKRVVSLMPKWNPGQQNGKSVRVKYVLAISFKVSGG